MIFSIYEWVYIVTNAFWTYTIYKFMEVFFNRKKHGGIVELFSYAIFFLLVTIICLTVNLPIVLLIINLVAFVALSYNYESKMKNRILSAVFIYLILAGVEIAVSLLSGYLNFSLFSANTYTSIYGLIACRIISYAVVLVLNNFKNIKRGEPVPNSNWFSIALIPVSSLYVNLLLFQARGISEFQVMLGVILILLINFATFYLYDVITAALSDKMQSLLILEQNKYYERQFEFIKSSLQTTNAIRHDLKNHMLSISSLVKEGDTNEALDYIADIMADIGTRQNYATSGNTVIDSIINFKFQEAEQKGIKTMQDITIPDKLDVPSFDMTIVLGNLLDNAIRAAYEVKENRFINVKIKYDKGRLLIQADNTFAGKIKIENGRFLTTKEDKDNHGVGLESIKKVMQKYNGTVNIEYSSDIFSVSLLMYVD